MLYRLSHSAAACPRKDKNRFRLEGGQISGAAENPEQDVSNFDSCDTFFRERNFGIFGFRQNRFGNEKLMLRKPRWFFSTLDQDLSVFLSFISVPTQSIDEYHQGLQMTNLYSYVFLALEGFSPAYPPIDIFL